MNLLAICPKKWLVQERKGKAAETQSDIKTTKTNINKGNGVKTKLNLSLFDFHSADGMQSGERKSVRKS